MLQRKNIQSLRSLALLLMILAGCGSRGLKAAVQQITPSAGLQTGSTPKGVQIRKYRGNFTCFKFETAEGVILITDPCAMDEEARADIVTVSHDHLDHADLSRITGKYRLITTAETITEKGIKITGVAGHHNKGDTAVTNIIYVFDLDGLRIAQFASQGEMPTEAMFARIGKVDILIIQIFGAVNGKLSTEEACRIAQRVQAKIVIPAHTDTNQTDALASLLTGGSVNRISTGKLTVTQAGLAAQTKPEVVVLDVE